MQESYWGYWLILLGVFIVGIMMLVNSTSTNNTQDYYYLKEATQASMIDSLDFAYFRLYGDMKMSKQKFVENFVRRLADNANTSNKYTIDFYYLYELPPKVSVKVSTKSIATNIANTSSNSYDVVNKIDEILEIGVPTKGTSSTAETKTCYIDFGADLISYLLGNTVDGFSIKTDNFSGTSKDNVIKLSHALQADSKNSEAGSVTPEDLKKEIVTIYTDAGVSGKQFFSTHPEFETWYERGDTWVKVN